MKAYLEENKFLDKDASYAQYFGSSAPSADFEEQYAELAPTAFQYSSMENFVKEKDMILSLIKDLVSIADSSIEKAECDKEGLEKSKHISFGIIRAIERYQEQPGLLDPILERMITPMVSLLLKFAVHCSKTKNYRIPPQIARVFEVVYSISKVRGYKVVTKYMSHEAADFEYCLELLVYQSLSDTTQWYATYVLQLWMSILVLVPFDIKSIDSSSKLTETITNHCLEALSTTGKCRDGASIMLAKYVTRPDIVKAGYLKLVLHEKLKVAYIAYSQDPLLLNNAIGVLQGIVEILRTGERKELISDAKELINLITEENENKSVQSNTIFRKYKVKLAERIGLVLLKPRVATWRYQRGYRSLLENLSKKPLASTPEKPEEAKSEEDIEIECAEEVETVLGYLLNMLKDKDTVVRWSAAKGVGRITGRLTHTLADEIVGNLLGLLAPHEPESSWHGGCLAIAELCRRGLLLPSRLDELMPLLEKALIYDVQKGNISVGKNVRDAACYVVWTFARAYSPEVMEKYVSKLAQTLLVVSLFDRETNCRRAASAAFQEHVGRQGNFPHGIDILTEADYFTLSNRQNAYLNVARFVGQFPEYYKAMVQHLVQYKLPHWDPNIRSLAAQALSLLVPFNPQYFVTELLPILCKKSVDKTLFTRHGAILGLGEILIGLCGRSEIFSRKNTAKHLFSTLTTAEQKLLQETETGKKFETDYAKLQVVNHISLLGKPMMDEISNLIQTIEKLRLYRGKGGEIMRSGVCKLLRSLAISCIPLTARQIKVYHQTLEENLRHPNESIQFDAKDALKEFSKFYHPSHKVEAGVFVQNLLKNVVTDENIAITRGYTMALGSLSNLVLTDHLEPIMEALCKNALVKNASNDDAETRMYAVKAIREIMLSLGLNNMKHTEKVIETLFVALNDYSVDRRGDIGSWVREEAMICFKDVLLLDKEAKFVKKEIVVGVIQLMLKQLAEKIDKVRQIAGNQLQDILFHCKTLEVPEKELLELIFVHPALEEAKAVAAQTKESLGYVHLPWRNADFTYKQLIPLIDSEAYREPLLEGWVISAGGITESTLRASSNSLLQYLAQANMGKKMTLLNTFVRILKRNKKVDRVIVPLVATIDLIYQGTYMAQQELEGAAIPLFKGLQEETKYKNIMKLCTLVGAFQGMMCYEGLRKDAVYELVVLLYHHYPKVRKEAAEKLYLALISSEDLCKQLFKDKAAMEETMGLLSTIEWTNKLRAIGGTREIIHKNLGLPPPITPMEKLIEKEEMKMVASKNVGPGF